MPRVPLEDQVSEPIREPSLSDRVGRQVLLALGRPNDLLRVGVHPVGNDRFRVNIFMGEEFTSGRIAHSFFLTADAKGAILSSIPTIEKVY